jgi:hypothetical protein
MTMTKTDVTSRSADAESQPTAQILPFPLLRTESGRFIAAEFARRPVRGRCSRQAYADGVLKVTAERLERLGVAQERIDGELAQLRALFWRIDGSSADAKARA